MTDGEKTPLAIISDSACAEPDLLNFNRYAEAIATLITNKATETPLTVGIFGGWGSGKTTLLEMVASRVEKKGMISIRFNPWLYQAETNLLIPLLQAISDTISESKVARVKQSASKILAVVAKVSASLLLKTITRGEVELDTIDGYIEKYSEKTAKSASVTKNLKRDLQGIVDDITEHGKDGGRIVIYIDDLDRCEPTKIVSVLEAIKLFLDLKHAVVLLAVDRDIVQRGIRYFYKDFEVDPATAQHLTTDYLDKIIQLPIYLPPIHNDQVETYIDQLITSESVAEHRDLWRACLLPNPRKIKRVLNIYCVLSSIASERQELDSTLLAKLVLIQQQWPELYRDIVQSSRLVEILEKVYRRELSLAKDSDWFSQDGTLEPLRDLAKRHFQPGSARLVEVFRRKGDFALTNLLPYLYLLG